MQRDGSSKDVAVKSLKEDCAPAERLKLLQEAAIMGQFKHHNVVQLYGVVAQGDPVNTFNYFQLSWHFLNKENTMQVLSLCSNITVCLCTRIALIQQANSS